MKPAIKILLDRAMHGDEQAWKKYQKDKLIPIQTSRFASILDSIVKDNRDFIAYILEQPTLAKCPTAMLERIIDTMTNINPSTEQKTRLITLLRESLKKPQPNKLGLSLALVFCHFHMEKHLTALELQQMLTLDEDEYILATFVKGIIFGDKKAHNGVAALIKGIIFEEKKTPADDTAAVAHLMRAEQAGNVTAKIVLAHMHLKGRVKDGQPQTTHNAVAVKLLKSAVQEGNVMAMVNLAQVLTDWSITGILRQVEREAESIRLLRVGVQAGHVVAMLGLAWQYQDSVELIAERVALLKCAVECGAHDAKTTLLELQNKIESQSNKSQHQATVSESPTATSSNSTTAVNSSSARSSATNSSSANFFPSASDKPLHTQDASTNAASSTANASTSDSRNNQLQEQLRLQSEVMQRMEQTILQQQAHIASLQQQLSLQTAQTTSSPTASTANVGGVSAEPASSLSSPR